jgi:hypothetical protein
MIKSGSLCGQSIIAYLQQKGFPEVALHFVKVSGGLLPPAVLDFGFSKFPLAPDDTRQAGSSLGGAAVIQQPILLLHPSEANASSSWGILVRFFV